MKRKYQETHPWLKFDLSLEHASYQLWLLLGECKSKIEHVAGVPLNPELRQRMHALYLAKGVHATTAIEGNTLSEAQVQQVIDGSLSSMPSQEYLRQEVQNVIRACNRLGERVIFGRPVKISPRLLKALNRKLMHRLPKKPDCSCRPGDISSHNVVVGNVYRGAPREDCEYLLQRLCDWLNGQSLDSDKLDPLVIAIIKATVAHLYVAWIHPFCDGNGRTARLLEFLILLKAGAPTVAGHLLSNHYNETRSNYYSELANTSRSGGDVLPFILYAVQGLRDQLIQQIAEIREQQIDVAWSRFVEETVPSESWTKHKRQCALIEAIGKARVPMQRLPVLTPTLARDYAVLSASTLSRDVAQLQQLNLIELDEGHSVRAKREIILELFPPRRVGDEKVVDSVAKKTKRPGRPRTKS